MIIYIPISVRLRDSSNLTFDHCRQTLFCVMGNFSKFSIIDYVVCEIFGDSLRNKNTFFGSLVYRKRFFLIFYGHFESLKISFKKKLTVKAIYLNCSPPFNQKIRSLSISEFNLMSNLTFIKSSNNKNLHLILKKSSKKTKSHCLHKCQNMFFSENK